MNSNNKMDGWMGALEIARAMTSVADQLGHLKQIAAALERLAGPAEDAHAPTCPECEGKNLSPHRLRYCRDCHAAHFEPQTPPHSR